MSTSTDELAGAMLAAWHARQPHKVVELASGAGSSAAGDERVLALLGMAQQATARHHDAMATFQRLSRLQPAVSAWWNNLGVACREAGDAAAAEQALLKARSLAPDDAEVHYNLGLLRMLQGRWLQAREALLEAVRRSPGFVEARLQAAHACHICGDGHGEETMLEGSQDWPPQPAEQALVLAGMRSARGELDAALQVLANALLPSGPAADVMRLRICARRASLYERSNRLAQAQAALENVPLTTLAALHAGGDRARIEGWRAHATLALRAGRRAEAADLFRRSLGLAADQADRASAAFGLAAALDRQRRHGEAWQALATAHAAQLATVRGAAPELFEPGAEPLPMTSRFVDADALADWKPLAAPAPPADPVFVIGFPRSGTTLLEQMLDAHPDLRSMGERGFIYDLIDGMERAGQPYPAALADLGQSDADQLRALYHRKVNAVLPDLEGRRLVDKNPLNLLCLPMILRLFPEASVILCRRHPCDVLLSCAMQPFRSPAFMLMCSSLERLSQGYARAFEQCCHHLRLLAPRLLEWRYESAVTATDEEIARLGRFLGTPDPSPMHDYAAHAQRKGFIDTPSYAQVTRPVDRAAMGRWESYRAQFEPVLPTLRPWIERFGYEA